MRELADRPDPRKKLPTPHAPRRTVHVRPSKAKKKGEQGDSVLTSVFRDGTRRKEDPPEEHAAVCKQQQRRPLVM